MGEVNIPIWHDKDTAYLLREDRLLLVVTRRVPGGLQTSVFERDKPFADADIALALEGIPAAAKHMEPGQCNTHWRTPTRFGTWYVSVSAGPPTWWLPKFKREKDGALMVGWLRRAVAVKFDWKEKKCTRES